MHHEKKIVKGTSKKYTTKKDGEKESISKRIDLGVNSAYNIDDEVVILSIDDFNKLTDGNAGEIQVLKNISAGKDNEIAALNKKNDKLNAELKSKLDLINELSIKLKASEKSVKELESDISEKDNIIAANEKDIADKDAEINQLKEIEIELSDKLDKSKGYLLNKDDIIAGLEKDLSKYDDINVSALKEKADKYDAADVDSLIGKADELDNAKNVIMKLQNEKIEYIQLVNYHKEKSAAYKNQNTISKLFGKDPGAEITAPSLVLIDTSGNPINDDNVDVADNDDNDNTD